MSAYFAANPYITAGLVIGVTLFIVNVVIIVGRIVLHRKAERKADGKSA